MEKDVLLFHAGKNRFIRASLADQQVTLQIGTPDGSCITKCIPANEWEDYLSAKLSAGYVQKESQEVKERKYHPVLDFLRRLSRQVVEGSLKLLITPSKKDIEEAERILTEMATEKDLVAFNKGMSTLIRLLPRKARNPILLLAKSEEDFIKILEREHDLLESLRTFSDDGAEDVSGVSFQEADKETVKMIKNHCGSLGSRVQHVYCVENAKQNAAFESYMKTRGDKRTTLLFHGSRNENWFSILMTKLKVNPVNVVITGKMFGNGIYFAPSAAKSYGYTSCRGSKWANGRSENGYLALYEVATGHEYRTDHWENHMTRYDKKSFEREHPGCDSFHALAGRNLLNDEVIVYDEGACRIRYLIEIA
jgi:poly [ADP-ribose] polymerase